MDGVSVLVGSMEASPSSRESSWRRERALRTQLRELQRALSSLQDEREAERQTLAERLRELAARPATADTTTALEALAERLASEQETAPDELEEQLGRLLADRCSGQLQYRARMRVRPEHLSPRIASALLELVREAVDCIVGMQVDRIGLTIENDADALLLRITDGGSTATTPLAARAPCVAALQRRASELGGTLFVTYGRRGTALQLRLLLD